MQTDIFNEYDPGTKQIFTPEKNGSKTPNTNNIIVPGGAQPAPYDIPIKVGEKTIFNDNFMSPT